MIPTTTNDSAATSTPSQGQQQQDINGSSTGGGSGSSSLKAVPATAASASAASTVITRRRRDFLARRRSQTKGVMTSIIMDTSSSSSASSSEEDEEQHNGDKKKNDDDDDDDDELVAFIQKRTEVPPPPPGPPPPVTATVTSKATAQVPAVSLLSVTTVRPTNDGNDDDKTDDEARDDAETGDYKGYSCYKYSFNCKVDDDVSQSSPSRTLRGCLFVNTPSNTHHSWSAAAAAPPPTQTPTSRRSNRSISGSHTGRSRSRIDFDETMTNNCDAHNSGENDISSSGRHYDSIMDATAATANANANAADDDDDDDNNAPILQGDGDKHGTMDTALGDDDDEELMKDFFKTINAYSHDDSSTVDDRLHHIRNSFGATDGDDDLSDLILKTIADGPDGQGTNGAGVLIASPEERDIIDCVFENVEDLTCNRFGDQELTEPLQQLPLPKPHSSHAARFTPTNALLSCYKSEPIMILSSEEDEFGDEKISAKKSDENSIIEEVTQGDDSVIDRCASQHKKDKKDAVPSSPLSFLPKLPTPREVEQWMSTFDDVTCVTNLKTGEKCPAVADLIDRAFMSVEASICGMVSDPSSSNSNYGSRRMTNFLGTEKDVLDTVFETFEEHVCSESESKSTFMLMTDEEDTTAFGSAISGAPNLSAVLSPSSSVNGSTSFLTPTSQTSNSTTSTTTAATSFSFNGNGRVNGVLSPKSHSRGASCGNVDSTATSNDNKAESISNLLSISDESGSDADDDDFLHALHEYGFKDLAIEDENENSNTGSRTRGFHQHQPHPLYVISEEVSATESGSEQHHKTRTAISTAMPTQEQATLDPLSAAAFNAATTIDASLKAAREQQKDLFAHLDDQSVSSRGSSFSRSAYSAYSTSTPIFPCGTDHIARRVRATNGGFTGRCFGLRKNGTWKAARKIFSYDEDEARDLVEEFRAGIEVAVHRLNNVLDAIDANVCGGDDDKDISRDIFSDDGEDTIHAVQPLQHNTIFSRYTPFSASTSMAITSTPIPSNVRVRCHRPPTGSASRSVRSVPSDERSNFLPMPHHGSRHASQITVAESREPDSSLRHTEMDEFFERRQPAESPLPSQHKCHSHYENFQEVRTDFIQSRVDVKEQFSNNGFDNEETRDDPNHEDFTNIKGDFPTFHFDLDSIHRLDNQFSTAIVGVAAATGANIDGNNTPQFTSINFNDDDQNHGSSMTTKIQDDNTPRLKSPKSSETCNTQRTADETITISATADDEAQVPGALTVEQLQTYDDIEKDLHTSTASLPNNENNRQKDLDPVFGNTEPQHAAAALSEVAGACTSDINFFEDSTTKSPTLFDVSSIYNARIIPLPVSPVASFAASVSSSYHNRNKDNLTPSSHSRASMQDVFSAAFSCNTAAAVDAVLADEDVVIVANNDSERMKSKGADHHHETITMTKMGENEEISDNTMIGESPTIYESARSNFSRVESSGSTENESCRDNDDAIDFESSSGDDSNNDQDGDGDEWQLRLTCTDIVVYEEKPALMTAGGVGGDGATALLQLWLYMIWCSLTFWLRVNGTGSSEDYTRKSEEMKQRKISIENALSRMSSKSEEADENNQDDLMKVDDQLIQKLLSHDVLDTMPSLEQQHSNTI